MYHQVLGVVNIKIDVTFRLFNLDKYQAITLHREVAGVTYAPHPEKNGLVGTVCLNQDLDNLDDLNIFYVRQQIPLQDCDILITVISENNQRTVAYTIKIIEIALESANKKCTLPMEITV